MSKDREYDEKMGLSRAGRPAIDSAAESKLRQNAKPVKSVKSVRPKNVNKNIKVSQSEIDSIKKMGMKKALSSAKTGSSSFGEGVRRLYGETRYQNAIYTPKASPGPVGYLGKSSVMSAKPKSNFTYQTGMSSPKKNTYQTGQNSPKVKAKAKDTSFKKSGVAGVLKSPESKKFRDTFKKKGLLPALRGK